MPGTTLCLEVNDAKLKDIERTLTEDNGIISKGNDKTCLSSSPLIMFQFEEPALGALPGGCQHEDEASNEPLEVLPTGVAGDVQQISKSSTVTSPSDRILSAVCRGEIPQDPDMDPEMLPENSCAERTDSTLTQQPDSPQSDENSDTQAALSNFDEVGAAIKGNPEVQKFQASRKDSLFDEIERTIPQHGPPSPTRSVRLPLRPKAPLTKHSSYDSIVLRPILDRFTAKKLGNLRPGSDPTLRQRFFPHVVVDTSTIAEYPRQTSLDSDGSKSSGESNNDSGIFERAVEPVSPLHIRKQAGIAPTKNAPSPCTPRETADPHTPDSSPLRTPSMGDRRVFDMQRAERNARYNAIHSGSYGAVINDNFDFQLADFNNAGPGSRGSTPGRNSGESDAGNSPGRLGHAVAA